MICSCVCSMIVMVTKGVHGAQGVRGPQGALGHPVR